MVTTVNQLTLTCNLFCQALDACNEIRVVFCDISKAFDCVWHAGLLRKLEAAGVSGILLAWFKTIYLIENSVLYYLQFPLVCLRYWLVFLNSLYLGIFSF